MEEKSTNIIIKDLLYTIKLVDSDYKELRSDNTKFENLGRTDPLRQVIYIRNDINMQRRLNVIIHEITHAFIDAYGFSNRTFEEEDLCTFNETYASDIVSLANKVLKEL